MNSLATASKLARTTNGIRTQKIQSLLIHNQPQKIIPKISPTNPALKSSLVNQIFASKKNTQGAKKPSLAYPVAKRWSCQSRIFSRKNKSVDLLHPKSSRRITAGVHQASAARKKKYNSSKLLKLTPSQNVASATHALRLAKLKGRTESSPDGSYDAINSNIGLFIKNWALTKRSKTTDAGVSFADHVKKAQERILNLKPTNVDMTSHAIVEEIKNFKPKRFSIHYVTPKANSKQEIPIHPTRKTASLSVRTHSTKGGKNSLEEKKLKKNPTKLEQQKTVIEDGFHPTGHSYFGQRPVLGYQPNKLPTLKSLLKDYKEKDRQPVKKKQSKPSRADDQYDIYKRKQLPAIKMNLKCPMDPFIMKKLNRSEMAATLRANSKV